jgi:hypothetical protein
MTPPRLWADGAQAEVWVWKAHCVIEQEKEKQNYAYVK